MWQRVKLFPDVTKYQDANYKSSSSSSNVLKELDSKIMEEDGIYLVYVPFHPILSPHVFNCMFRNNKKTSDVNFYRFRYQIFTYRLWINNRKCALRGTWKYGHSSCHLYSHEVHRISFHIPKSSMCLKYKILLAPAFSSVLQVWWLLGDHVSDILHRSFIARQPYTQFTSPTTIQRNEVK
jgi:hypothetical protein